MSNELFGKNLTVNDITKLIDRLENSTFNFLAVEDGENKIIIGKEALALNGSSGVTAGQVQSAVNQPQLASVATLEKVEESSEVTIVEELSAASTQPQAVVQEGIEVITATTTGIYYAQSEPGAAPYVTVGAHVNEDSTVGLIEIMKVFSAIPAGVKGEVVAIHVEDAQLVEYGSPLISVKVK